MSKEVEEFALIAIVALFVLKLLGGSTGSALQAQRLQSTTDLGYANDAASVLNNAFDDLS